MERSLQGARVLVTGGGVRLGRAIAEGLARAGAEVAIHYHRSGAEARSVLSSLRAEGCRAKKFKADLTNPDEIVDLVNRVEAQLGPLSALVNGAAIFERSGFLKTSVAALQRHWEVNTRGPFLLTQAVAARMQRRSGGEVVNILDIGGALVPWRNYSAYCISKAAMAMLTRCLALELAPKIRVNAVAPGTVLPPEGMEAGRLEELRRRIPQQRFASPQEVVDSVIFLLAGPRFITGQILAVDGGRSLSAAEP